MNNLLLYIPSLVVIIGIILPLLVSKYTTISRNTTLSINLQNISELSFYDQMIIMMLFKNQVKCSSSLLIFVIVWISVYISLNI